MMHFTSTKLWYCSFKKFVVDFSFSFIGGSTTMSSKIRCLALLTTLFSFSLLADTVKVFIWDEYISEDTIAAFKEKTGHTVKLYYYDDEVARDAILMSGRALNYDLILVDNSTSQKFSTEKVFTSLKLAKIPNRQHIGEKWRQACSDAALPYAKGTMGIAYRSSVAITPITSWHHLLNPAAEHVGKTTMLKDDIDTIAIALMAMGKDPFSKDKADLKAAYDLLLAQKPKLLSYQYAVSYAIEQSTKSTLSLAAVYAGDIFQLKEKTGQQDWVYITPKEGTLFWVDCFVAPANKAISEASLQFLDFISEPTIAIKNAETIWVSTTNDSAMKLGSSEYLTDTELNATEDVIENSYFYKVLPTEAVVFRNRIISSLAIAK